MLIADERPLLEQASARKGAVAVGFQRRERQALEDLEQQWRLEARTADPVRKNLLTYWVEWARTIAPLTPKPLDMRITVLDWGGVPLIALPGEIFAETALSIRSAMGAQAPAFVIGFADDNPGYIPPASEFAHGGYEVDEAHRYYGQPMTFASGSAEAIASCAIHLLAGR